MNKIILILSFLLFHGTTFSQSLDVNGNNYIFNQAINPESFCPKTVESYDAFNDYIKCLNCDFGNIRVDYHIFKENLVCLDIIVTGTPFPEIESIEKVLKNYIPYKQEDVQRHAYIVAYEESFKTDNFYIVRSTMRDYSRYYIVPIITLEKIRSEHPDYLKDEIGDLLR